MMSKKIKKDFNKDKMYEMIMPTGAVSTMERPLEAAVPAAQPELAHDAADEQFLLCNLTQNLLLEKLDHTMRMLRACDCERCRQDVLAVALNALPPAYAVVASGSEDQQRLRGEREIKVTAALIKAVQAVKASPRH